MNSPKITIAEVAKKAGVSLGSASRALNNAGASPEMVEKVSAAATELGYSPDLIGRSLRTKRTNQIAFAVADIGNPVYVEMLAAVEQAVAPKGYRVLVTSTGDSASSTVELINSLQTGFVDGMIISPLRPSEELTAAIENSTVPIVIIGRSIAQGNVDTVSTNSPYGIELAVNHVIEQGAQRIGFLNGPIETTPGSARLRGFQQAINSHNLSADNAPIVVANDFTVKAGQTAALKMLTKNSKIDAIIAANDLLAIGAIKAAHQMHLDVPEDLLVTGMDDTQLAEVFDPSLTSVSLASGSRAGLAAEILLNRLDHTDSSPTTAVLEPKLVVRLSTQRARN